jgi:hypothetical protein
MKGHPNSFDLPPDAREELRTKQHYVATLTRSAPDDRAALIARVEQRDGRKAGTRLELLFARADYLSREIEAEKARIARGETNERLRERAMELALNPKRPLQRPGTGEVVAVY